MCASIQPTSQEGPWNSVVSVCSREMRLSRLVLHASSSWQGRLDVGQIRWLITGLDAKMWQVRMFIPITPGPSSILCHSAKQDMTTNHLSKSSRDATRSLGTSRPLPCRSRLLLGNDFRAAGSMRRAERGKVTCEASGRARGCRRESL